MLFAKRPSFLNMRHAGWVKRKINSHRQSFDDGRWGSHGCRRSRRRSRRSRRQLRLHGSKSLFETEPQPLFLNELEVQVAHLPGNEHVLVGAAQVRFCNERKISVKKHFISFWKPDIMNCNAKHWSFPTIRVSLTFYCSTSTGLVLDSSIDIFKLSTLQVPSINHSDIMKNPWERWDSNPGMLGEESERYLCAMPPTDCL